MTSLDEKYDLIEEYETGFAHRLATKLIPNPQLSVWMILIPIIFVYYFYQKDRYKTGCEEFVHHYMVSRKRALDAARKAVEGGGDPDCGTLAKTAKLPESAFKVYIRFMEILVCHFQELLSRDGAEYQDLLRETYENKTNFLLFCNQLNSVERELNQVLTPAMEETQEKPQPEEGEGGYNEAVDRMEQFTESLRREEAERFFS